jgi:ubiquitin-protein ligase
MEQNHQRQKRLTQELKLITTDPPDGITAGPNDDEMSFWSASIAGPPGSPYAGGTFFLEIEIPSNYPAKPPSIKFKTAVYHPNISSIDGSVFVDVLGEMWCPALTLSTILVSVQSLLTDPNPEDPCEFDIGREYVDDRETFDKTAEEWTVMYAMG